jgi:hypothetical protein
VAWDDAPPQRVALDPQDGSPAWAQGVLDGERVVTVRLSVKAPGAHTLRVDGIAAGVVIDRLTIASAAGETGKEPRR